MAEPRHAPVALESAELEALEWQGCDVADQRFLGGAVDKIVLMAKTGRPRVRISEQTQLRHFSYFRDGTSKRLMGLIYKRGK